MLSSLVTLHAIFMSEQPTRTRNEEESTIEFAAHEDFVRHNIPPHTTRVLERVIFYRVGPTCNDAWAGKTPSALSPVSPSLTAYVQYTTHGNIS